jgi:chromatin remodeling complex protein RSC6
MSENLVIEVVSPTKKPETSEEAAIDTVESLIKGLSDHATLLKAEVATLQQKIKQLEKIVKQDKKKTKSQEPKVVKKKPSGFALPMPISEALCKFMKKPTGSKVARTDVTKFLVKYVKDNKLEDQENHRIICPNEELHSILSAKEGDEVTYFNLQSYINHHFTEKQT